MKYDILEDWELSREVFYAANPNTDLKYNSVRSELLGSVKVQNFSGGKSEVFSINDFDDIMPIIINHGIGYQLQRGDDYKPDLYKASYVEDTGFQNFTTRDKSVFRALAICYLKVHQALINKYGAGYNEE